MKHITTKRIIYILLGIITGIVLAIYFWTPSPAGATFNEISKEETECVEVNAPDPINFSKKIGIITFSFQWQEEPEGTWKLYKDIDPRGGHEFWVKTGDKIVENACPQPLPDYCPEEGYQPYGPCLPTEPGNPPTFAGSSTNPPGVCKVEGIGVAPHINVEVGTPNDGKLLVQWPIILGADQVHIVYRQYDEPTWTHALLNTPNDGNEEIGELKNGVNYAFAVAGVKGCGVGLFSQEFDPRP